MDDTERTVAGTSFCLIAFLAEGSNLRDGPSRKEVSSLLAWLWARQQEDGTFAVAGARATQTDQLLAALALVHGYGLSTFAPWKRTARQACHAVVLAFAAPDAPATAEEAALLALVTDAARTFLGEGELTRRLHECTTTALEPLHYGASRRGDAALHLAQLLLGEPLPADLTIARVWPADLARDPLHSWFALCALHHHEGLLRTQEAAYERLLAARVTAGPQAGTWSPAADHDRATTTAILAACLGIANGAWRRAH